MAGKNPGKYRMKRPQPPNAETRRYEHNIKKAYSKEQLSEIGAIALIWNQIDEFINFLLMIALNIPLNVWMEVAKRINGMDGKLAILQLRADRSRILSPEAKACIKLSLDAVAEYKKYRDAIVHSVPFDVERGITQRFDSRAKISQILLTIDALSAFYQRLELLLAELPEIDLLFRLADEVALRRSIVRGSVSDPLKLRRERDVPVQTIRAQEHQKKRLSLPPLPEFPDESLTPPTEGATAPHPHPEEKP